MNQGINIHFAFPDRAFAYDCGSCDQRCCKTGTLAVSPRERPLLERLHPGLELAAREMAGDIACFVTPLSGCWFLLDARCALCDAHTITPANAARPSACSIFPFNLFGTYQQSLVVAPNPLCPLPVHPGQGLSHEEVLKSINDYGAAGSLPPPLRTADPDGGIALERVVRHAAGAGLDTPSPTLLIAFERLATDAFMRGGRSALASLDLAPLDDIAFELEREFLRMSMVVGVPMPPQASLNACNALLAAWTPALRLFGFEDAPLTRLPRLILALTLYVAHWHSLSRERTVSPHALMQLLNSLRPNLAFLAALDVPWPAASVETLGLVKGSVPNVDEIVERLPVDPLARTAALRGLGSTLTGGLR